MVVEKLEELRQIITVSKQLGVEPLIGIRARLLSKGAGKWAESGGENAKFGLSTAELLAATEMLKAENLGHCFKLLHFHIGSQVPDILTVKKAVQEAARFYAKLYKMGFQIEYLDVGGGLGVDYDGSRSAFDSSTNYTLQEYTNDIVYYIADVCNAEKVPHPDIVSESGRAIVAHHSVLIVEVFGAIEKQRPRWLSYGENEHALVRELLDIKKNIARLNKLEARCHVRQSPVFPRRRGADLGRQPPCAVRADHRAAGSAPGQRAGRIITTASGAHYGARIPFDDLRADRSYSQMGFGRYGETKLANILFTAELARRLVGTGVTANCYTPGFVGTGFGHNNGPSGSWRCGSLVCSRANPIKAPRRWSGWPISPAGDTRDRAYFVDKREVRPSPAGARHGPSPPLVAGQRGHVGGRCLPAGLPEFSPADALVQMAMSTVGAMP